MYWGDQHTHSFHFHFYLLYYFMFLCYCILLQTHRYFIKDSLLLYIVIVWLIFTTIKYFVVGKRSHMSKVTVVYY
jgi:hypothetical protein